MKEARGICLAYVGGDRPALPAPGAQSFQQPTQHAVTTWPSATPPTGSNLFAATPPVKVSSVRAITETELLNAVRREQSVQFVFRQEPKRSAALANLVGGEYRCFSQGQNRVVAIQVKVQEEGEECVAGTHCIYDRSKLNGRDLADFSAANA